MIIIFHAYILYIDITIKNILIAIFWYSDNIIIINEILDSLICHIKNCYIDIMPKY